ncbi:MAG TPA: SRPBCC family protein [Devosiaceae bacterium]|jgi:uncharacterized protein YndB with AHSA1/START domain
MDEDKIVSLSQYRARRQAAAPTEWQRVLALFWGQNLDRLDDYVHSVQQEELRMQTLEITAPSDQPLIVMTRAFVAPRALVWRAFTDPMLVSNWWGPRRARVTVVKLDLRPGGNWCFEDHRSDGRTFVFRGTYLEVVAPERIVNTFGMQGMDEDKLLVETHTFEERDGVTHYRSLSRFDSVADRDRMLDSGMESGARESLERLAELLATLD